MAPTLERWPVGEFKLGLNIRLREFDAAELRPLGESLIVKQLAPVGARRNKELIWGFRRLAAAKLVGLAALDVIVLDEAEEDTRLFQLWENVFRSDLSDFELSQALIEQQQQTGWSGKKIAEFTKLSQPTVSRYLGVARWSEPLRNAFKSGVIGIAEGSQIHSLPEEQQAKRLDRRLGTSKGNGQDDSSRLSRIECPLNSGVTVQIKGADLTLDAVIKALAEAYKEAKKGRKQKFTVNTWAQAMKDRARGNGNA